MNPLLSYLPQDRLRALARGQSLPDQASGAVLFADISGFTPLAEALAHELGPRRGVDELSRQINAVYDALIAQIERFGGSVTGFAGDAITCWFDDEGLEVREWRLGDDDSRCASSPQLPASSLRAVACALELQTAMRAFAARPLPGGARLGLALKAAVAAGPIRRFVVGDPAIQLLDTLAGATVGRMALGEHLARPGEVLADAAALATVGALAQVAEWRSDADTGARFAVVTALQIADRRLQIDQAPEHSTIYNLQSAILRPWLLPAVYAREQAGQGALLPELRPAVALFLRFEGIDYEREEAGAQLDAFIRQVQGILARYDGVLLQLTIGDKGSYLYASFGALHAHEDDPRRALSAALDLRHPPADLAGLPPVQMGVSQGLMRVGAYGGTTRRTYGALGDDVNLAARLMQAALPGEIVVSGRVQVAGGAAFTFEPRPPLAFKGKAEPLPVFAVTGRRQPRAIRLQEPTYALPMVGRQAELALIGAKLDLALRGQGQIVGITAEAGLGKSRLVAEVIRLARRSGFVGYGGACQADGLHTPYLVWRTIWRAVFGLDPDLPPRKLLRTLEGELDDRAPERVEALPLLGALLGLSLPDNDFTRTLEPKERKSALHALLEACMTAAARDEPLLLVLEDVHWLDALSHDLLDDLAQASAALPVVIVLAYRPPELQRLQAPRVESLPHYTRITLEELSPAEAEQAIRARLAQLYPARSGSVPPALVEQLMARAQGNPFYLEELLNYLHDRGLDPRDPAALAQIALPDSLHALILSRLDQLSAREQTTFKVASIVGRVFRAAWLPGYYPALGELPAVQADLAALAQLEITPLYTPEPELAYLFKHIVTHEVAYESLPAATRARLHEQLAGYLETTYAEALPLDALAFHYGRSTNKAKQRLYFAHAAAAAQAAYANEAALAYYEQLLPLLSEPEARLDLHLRRGAVLELIGSWPEAEADYRAALALGEQIGAPAAIARSQHALGMLYSQRGEYDAALEWLGHARDGWAALDDAGGQAQALVAIGMVYWRQGEYGQARAQLEAGLAPARAQGDRATAARALNNLGNVVSDQGDYAAARMLYDESLALWRALGDKVGIAMTLNNLGGIALEQGEYAAARMLYDESLALRRAIGDKRGIAMTLSNLGNVVSDQGDYGAARALSEEGLVLYRAIGDKLGIAAALTYLGKAVACQGNYGLARSLSEESLDLWRAIGNRHGIAFALEDLGFVAYNQGDYATARAFYDESLALLRALGDKRYIAEALEDLGNTAIEAGEFETARTHYVESLLLAQEIGVKLLCAYDLNGLAAVVRSGAPQRTVRLVAAAETLRKAIDLAWQPNERRIYERTVAAARAALSEAAFAAAWAEGAAMSLDETVAYALASEE
jgi:class 3 adenylate cyclase/tetratricopeptide (TPR) repeat protein